ncbi:MAG: toprim domain-containing protein [Gammaproteobacteria bacterium]
MMMAKEVSQLLARSALEVARLLLPHGVRKGNEWCAGSVGGEEGRSLKVHVAGEKAGVWCDFATGDSGDLLDLWCLNRKIRLVAALKEARVYLGVGGPIFEAYKPKNFNRPTSKQEPDSPDITSKAMLYLINERKLTAETISKFKVVEDERKIVFPYWRDSELIFVKHLGVDRIDGKKQIRVEPNCEPCLFGWHLVPATARKIIICEGEIDAMTLYQYGFSALSVPFGGGGGDKQKWIEYEFDRMSIYDEIYLCFDNDEQGKLAVLELVNRLGRYRCRVATLPKKDANECLQAGISREQMQRCFDMAVTLDPEELKSAHHFVDEVINEFYPADGAHLGYNPPWDKAKGKILFRPEELSVWTGINGHGKSQFLGQVMLHSMQQGARICIASLELKPRRLLMRLTRQAAALAEPTTGYIRAIHQWYEDKLWLFDLVGTAKSARLLEVFLYARQRYGIDVFVIDSFMKLDIAEDDYKAQKAFMEQLCDFKNQHNCHIHIIVHPRKGADESQPPGKLDNKGTGAIADLADNCFTVWRNKAKERLMQIQATGGVLNSEQQKKLEGSDCIWCCDKQRNGDWEGQFGFWFHAGSLQYMSTANQRPIHIVDYSNPDINSVKVGSDT